MDPLKIAVPLSAPPPTHLPHTCTHKHTQNNKKSIGFPLLISGCHFSVVYLILSFCLYPSIVPPRLPAFVRDEGGHLSSMLPLPSSLSSQTTMEASVWLGEGETLFASVSVCEAVCVCWGVEGGGGHAHTRHSSSNSNAWPSYFCELSREGCWCLLLLMYFKGGGHIFLWWLVTH